MFQILPHVTNITSGHDLSQRVFYDDGPIDFNFKEGFDNKFLLVFEDSRWPS